jgi:hypothetical protein
MIDTLREVMPGLWVSDLESARTLGEDFALVVDCTGWARPTGSTGHTWTPEDLDGIVSRVAPLLESGEPVLIHCRRGVSRSACAAAAVLLATGASDSVKGALARTAYEAKKPSSQSVGGLRKWWKARVDARQVGLFG